MQGRISRREMLRETAGAALALGPGARMHPAWSAPMPVRALGRTGCEVSLLGPGGFHIGVDSLSEKQSTHLIPMTAEERVAILERSKPHADGQYERFKTTHDFEGAPGRQAHDLR